jgi:hypothetical protein
MTREQWITDYIEQSVKDLSPIFALRPAVGESASDIRITVGKKYRDNRETYPKSIWKNLLSLSQPERQVISNEISERSGEYEFYEDTKEQFAIETIARAKKLEEDRIAKGITVDGVNCKIVKEFQIAHVGWESDNTGWIVEHDGLRKLVMTNHGNHYFATKEELQSKIEEYNQLIADAESALSMI